MERCARGRGASVAYVYVIQIRIGWMENTYEGYSGGVWSEEVASHGRITDAHAFS